MAQDNPFAEFFKNNDFAKAFEQYQNLPFDMTALMDIQRKNVQAMTEAQQLAVHNMQSIAQRQSEIVSQIIEDNAKIAKEMMGEGSPEDKMAKNADMFKSVYERTIKNMNDLSDMIKKSNEEASGVISNRVSASMGEIKSAMESIQKKAA